MDYPTWYERIAKPFRNPVAARAVNVADKVLVYFVAATHIAALTCLALTGDGRFWRVLAVPAVTFAVVSAVRTALDAPRPYEEYDIDPIIRKGTGGKALPSRHVASAAIIACALAWLNPVWGAVSFIACAGVALMRVVGGVHYPRDIAAALVLALAAGAVGFVLIQ